MQCVLDIMVSCAVRKRRVEGERNYVFSHLCHAAPDHLCGGIYNRSGTALTHISTLCGKTDMFGFFREHSREALDLEKMDFQI